MPFGIKLRNLRRYGQIAAVMVRYGFHDLAHDVRIAPAVADGGCPPPEPVPAPRPALARMAMEELGPTFIKLGQVLSMRPDLIPPEWADEFKRLQTDCPQIDFAVVRRILEEEFPGRVDEIFAHIDPVPLAAASMAQVHRATLHGGGRAVIKVLRPGIRRLTRADLDILRSLAETLERRRPHMAFSPTAVVKELARELRKEVDLIREGQATDEFAEQFRHDRRVRFPKVYWEATTRNVLTLEEIRGVLLARVKPGQLGLRERRAVVANGARAIMRQCLEIGFFHADPHPGNLFALPAGAIGFIDCGMNGRMDETTTAQLAELISALSAADNARTADVILALADADPDCVDQRAFRADVGELVAKFQDSTLERFDLAALLADLFEKLRQHRLRCPGDLVLLLKAISTIEAVGAELDPSFDIIRFARPHLEALVERRRGLWALLTRAWDAVVGYAELAERLPTDGQALLTSLRKGRLTVRIAHRNLGPVTRSVEQAAWTLGLGMVLSALVVASALLVIANRDPGPWGFSLWGALLFVVATALSFKFLHYGWKGRRRRR